MKLLQELWKKQDLLKQAVAKGGALEDLLGTFSGRIGEDAKKAKLALLRKSGQALAGALGGAGGLQGGALNASLRGTAMARGAEEGQFDAAAGQAQRDAEAAAATAGVENKTFAFEGLQGLTQGITQMLAAASSAVAGIIEKHRGTFGYDSRQAKKELEDLKAIYGNDPQVVALVDAAKIRADSESSTFSSMFG